MESVREMIVQAVQSRLETIATLQGYDYDLSGRVYRAQKTVDEDLLPCAVVWDGQERSERLHGSTRQTMTVTVELHDDVATENQSILANRMLANIRRAVETRDAVLANLTEGIEYEGSDIKYPETGVKAIGVMAQYSITYLTKRGSPEEQ